MRLGRAFRWGRGGGRNKGRHLGGKEGGGQEMGRGGGRQGEEVGGSNFKGSKRAFICIGIVATTLCA